MVDYFGVFADSKMALASDRCMGMNGFEMLEKENTLSQKEH